ncbi:hypothetical protein EXS74_00855 [Candidatus Woesearchaeota archaeon]|nr:hypothetical protein [Candidatus Woesearchaeota archaeon]
MTNPTPAPADPHKKFKDITDVMLVETQDRAQALETRLTLAWADQYRTNPTDHGKGMGEALYNAGAKYVREELYGLTSPLGGNANLATQVDAIIAQTLGVSKTQLVDTYKDQKVVNAGDIESVVKATGQGLGKAMQGIQAQRLRDLGESDKDAFVDYVLALGAEVGATKLKKENMPTLHEAIEQYAGLMPLVAQYRGIKKSAANYGKP